MSKTIADLVFKNAKNVDEVLAMFPKRNLPDGAEVTRIAPSPTGFIHLGNLFGAMIDEKLAHQSDGVFYLRIEDTDAKRKVEGAIEAIISSLSYYGLNFDEGATAKDDNGFYGPYIQSKRAKIYHAFAKKLIENGLAYLCFCSDERLNEIREQQRENKHDIGYHGEYAVCRNLSEIEVKQKIENGEKFVVRLNTSKCLDKPCVLKDKIRGEIVFPKNINDIVLLKQDGIPTYHFAHVVDDFLMGTTVVVRGQEWLPSTPIHLQLFDALKLKAPKYAHTSEIMKMDGESKRKLSKRKDPEFALAYYIQEGYPIDAIKEYLLTILNSNFEDWRRTNKNVPLAEFNFSLDKMSKAGMLFDLAKLNDISKEIVAKMSTDDVFEDIKKYALKFNLDFYKEFIKNEDFSKEILAIDRGKRKDIYNYNFACDYLKPYYKTFFKNSFILPHNIGKTVAKQFLEEYLKTLDFKDDKNVWFEKIKCICPMFNFATRPKDYLAEPEKFKGHVGDLASVLRLAIVGSSDSPDVYAVMQALGEIETKRRINLFLEKI